jgi:hypothetical protein
LEQLAADPDPLTRCNLAANPRTPVSLLAAWLEKELGGNNGLAAVKRLLSPAKQPAQPSNKKLLTALARNPRATPALLRALAEHHSGKAPALVELRAAVAAHKRTPVDMLENLARQTDPAIRRSLAANPHPPLHVLEQLLTTEDAELWSRIAHHPAVIGDHRRILIALLMTKVAAWSGAPAWFFAQQTELPVSRLDQLLKAASWRDRYLVARHPKASQEMLMALARDGNRFVRAAARTTLIKRAQPTKRQQQREKHDA